MMYSIPAWELQEFLKGAFKYIRDTAALAGAILGAVLLVWGFVIIGKGFFAQQGQPVPWGKGFAAIIIGGILAFGTWNSLYKQVGQSMNNTVTNMGNGKTDGGDGGMIVAKSHVTRPVMKNVILPK